MMQYVVAVVPPGERRDEVYCPDYHVLGFEDEMTRRQAVVKARKRFGYRVIEVFIQDEFGRIEEYLYER